MRNMRESPVGGAEIPSLGYCCVGCPSRFSPSRSPLCKPFCGEWPLILPTPDFPLCLLLDVVDQVSFFPLNSFNAVGVDSGGEYLIR